MINYSVVLPASGPKPSYYSAYVGYIKGLLDACGQSYELNGRVKGTKFLMHIDGKSIAIDYSDHYDVCESLFDRPYFKFHCPTYLRRKQKNVYPFAPISFYDWKQYRVLKKRIQYACNNDTVLNLQEPRAGATKRRRYVQEMLRDKFGISVITKANLSQVDYWKLINSCLVHVFVPGARNNMLDRGIFQYMFFGCCCITTDIPEILPYNQKFIPGKDYVICKNDYSDLCDRIEWVRSNRKKAVEIGNNAKRKCLSYFTPPKLWDWIIQNVNL